MPPREVTLAKGNETKNEAPDMVQANLDGVDPATVDVVDSVDQDAANDSDSGFDDMLFLDEDVTDGESGEVHNETESVEVDMADMMDDETKSVNGVWRPFDGKSEVLVARAGNTKAQAMLSRLYTANRAQIDAGGDVADKISKRVYLEVEAKCLVLGFRHMQFAGDEVAYSPKAALFFLTRSSKFRNFITKQSQTTENYTRKASEQDIEKAKKLLSGS